MKIPRDQSIAPVPWHHLVGVWVDSGDEKPLWNWTC
jgi:hypothetical protein